MAGDAAAAQPVLEHRLGQHRGGPQRRVAGVVDEHRDPPARARRRARTPSATCSRASASVCSIHGMPPTTSAPSRIASSHSSAAPGSRSRPSWGNATTWRSTTPRNSSRSVEHGVHALQPRRGVDVGEGLHVQHAVAHRLVEGAPDVRHDPRAVVVLLDRRGVADDRRASPRPCRRTVYDASAASPASGSV